MDENETYLINYQGEYGLLDWDYVEKQWQATWRGGGLTYFNNTSDLPEDMILHPVSEILP